MNLAEWLVRTARRLPNAPALLSGKNVITDYAEFGRRVAVLASALQARLGIGRGDRVAIVMPNSVEYLELLYATWFAGAAVVPINFKLHAKEAAWIVENAEAKAVFVSESAAADLIPLIDRSPGLAAALTVESREFAILRTAELMSAPVTRARDDLAWLFYTSGTTGKPRGVMISNGNLHAMAFSYFVDVDEVRSADAILYAAPMSHGAGLYNFMHVMRGARHVVPESGGFEADEILALAHSLRDISMFAAPTMVRRLVDQAKIERSNGDGIRTIVYGGGQCTWRILRTRSR
jgi:acyl-CoA synthetase (AMP-forming)/AMP-acid ligase II